MEELSNTESESKEVQIPIGTIYLNGYLNIPTGARGIVVFARGSGSKSLGRPDLAEDALMHVEAPTLFIVGEKMPK